MGPTEILLSVAFLLFSTGLGLALATVGPIGFLVARGCFCFAALDVLALAIWWLYTSEAAGWKLAIGVALGAATVGVLPDVLRWIDQNEQAVIAQQKEKIVSGAAQIAPLVETIRRQQQQLEREATSRDIISKVLTQYDQLQQGISVFEQWTGRRDEENRLAAAEHIINELKALLGNVQTIQQPNGQALIIKTAPNSFLVTFPVPMRIPPAISFQNLPPGTTANILEKSNIGFSVVFTPRTTPVETFGFQASAEL